MHGLAWTHEEDATLIQLRMERGRVPAIAGALGRTAEAVYARCAKLDAKVMVRKDWTSDDVACLRGMFADGLAAPAIAAKLERTVGSVRWKIDDLGMTRPDASGRWTVAETETLQRLHAERATRAQMVEATGRSSASVNVKLQLLGLEDGRADWSAQDDDLLRGALELRLTAGDLAAKLERTESAVRARAAKIGARLGIHGSGWTGDDEATLRRVLGSSGSVEQAAAELGRTPRATRIHAVAIGLLEKTGPTHLTPEAKARIAEAAKTMGLTVAAKQLGHDVRTLKLVADEEGFSFLPGRKPKEEKPVRSRTPKVRVARTKVPVPVKVAAPKPAPARVAAAPVREAEARASAPSRLRAPGGVSALAARFLAFREGARK